MNNYIVVGTANLYREPTFHSEMVTQAVLGEQVEIIEKSTDFVRIRCEDDYEGWVHYLQVVPSQRLPSISSGVITADRARFYATSDTGAPVVRDAVAGSYVYPVSHTESWVQVLLPDEVSAWLPAEDLLPMGKFSRGNLIAYARRFEGFPYYWGGKTAKGFDCSGFTQFVHKMFGVAVRRDAWMQFEDGRCVSDDPVQGEPGDLLFFAGPDDRIAHVGFCLGHGAVLHARGMVRLNSLLPEHPLFSESLVRTFVGIRTFV